MGKRKWSLASTSGCCALLVFTSVLEFGCLMKSESRNSMPNRDIKTVMDAHVEELMAIPGVVAVAIGQLDDETPCIKVYVIEQTDELDRRIPKSLEDHPVVVEVSGEIKPMSGKNP